MEYAIIVIDIGMTNKKVAVYDDCLNPLDTVYKVFDPLLIKNPVTSENLKIHDLKGMQDWFFDKIADFARKYPVKVISVTTHGATFVCTDRNGEVCAPCIFYTENPSETFQQEFYEFAGDKLSLQETTFTPALDAMINPAKGIYYLEKYFPAEFAKTQTILFYPQYWGFLLTGEKGVEPTYTGCHTYLWDHKKQTWSAVADKLNIRQLMPENYCNTCTILGSLTPQIAKRLGLTSDTVVTMGIHDSNASLLPYLVKEKNSDFVLNSTGTWCVSMHSQNDLSFTKEDLGKVVFFNQSAFGKPVKTSIFLGGMEFDTWTTCYKEINGTSELPQYTEKAVNDLLAAKDTFLLPEVIPGSGQFTSSKSGIMEKGIFFPLKDILHKKRIPSVIKNEYSFIAVLELSLVIQTETALKRAGLKTGTKVFTEGGFRKNKLYNSLLPAVLHDNPAFRTSMTEATAFGAAMTAVIALTGKTQEQLVHTIRIEYSHDLPGNFTGYEAYKKKWLELAENPKGAE